MGSTVQSGPSPSQVVVLGVLAGNILPSTLGHPGQPAEPMMFARKNHTDARAHLVGDVAGLTDICIVSHHTDARKGRHKTFDQLSQANHEQYAHRHGYAYRKFSGHISGDTFTNPVRGSVEDTYGGGAYWQKLSAMAAVADEVRADGSPVCRWLMWMDADCVFTNQAQTIESIISRFAPFTRSNSHNSIDAILARESSGWPANLINSGVFFVKNSWKGRELIEGTARLFDRYKDVAQPDQDALQDYAFGLDPSTLKLEEHKIALSQLRPEIVVAPHRAFNSFYWVNMKGEHLLPLSPHYVLAAANWHPCDFIGQLPGLDASVRLSGVSEMIELEKNC